MTESVSSDKPLQTSPANPYEGVGRQAWILLWVASGLFLFLIIGTPLAVRWFVENATVSRYTQVEAIRGTPLVLDAGVGDVTGVVSTLALSEGDLMRTDEEARANISVYASGDADLALASVQLRNNTDVVFEQARAPRFRSSSQPDRINLRLDQGRARVIGNAREDRPVEITIKTPHAVIHLKDGDDVAIAVTNDATEVSDRGGDVRVEAEGEQVVLSSGQRTAVALGSPPASPQAGPINLVKNGDFSEPLEKTWTVESIVDAGDPSAVTHGTVTVTNSGERNAAYFVRQGEEVIHTETGITQKIDADVLDFDSLILRLDARLLSQSLAGAGQQSSEFPLMARIDFIDVNGNPQFWTWGFYAKDPVANWPIRGGEKIPEAVWYDYESPDFMQSPTFPRPQKVTSIRIYASGHNYRSQAANIGLIAQ